MISILFSSKSFSQVSLTFSNGYLGTQNSAVQSTNNIKNFSTLGIARVSFGQSYSGTFGGTQGNDLAGVIKLYLNSGQIISLNGALNWRETVTGNVVVYGLIIDAGQTATITYGTNQTYTITGGSTSGTSTSIGLRSYLSTLAFTDGESRSGNAATTGIIADMNAELANTPQPSYITLTNNSVIEGQNLVYTVTLSSATTAGRPQVYSFNTAGTGTKASDYNSTYTFSNGVTDNGDGTITVPGGVSSFSITVTTIDDVIIENIETLLLSVGSKTAIGSIADNDNLNIANCDPNSLYDNIVSGYHQSIAKKSDGSYSVWGNIMANNGTSHVLSPLAINSTNYSAIGSSTILKSTVAGGASSSASQAIVLTTDGLYAWGSAGNILATSLTSNLDGFAKIATPTGGDASTKLPAGVTPGSVKMMTSTYQTLIIVTNSGNVWVLTQTNGELRGVGTTTAASTTWNKVKIDANTDLSNVIAVRGMVDDATHNGLMALTADGKAYVWGKSVYLGDGTAVTSKSYATLMTLPTEFSITNLPKMIAVTGGNKTTTAVVNNTFYILSNSGTLYGLGDNQKKQIGDFTTTERKTWTPAKINSTTNFTNVNFISAMESDPSDPAVVIITKSGDLYTWGFNAKNMIGRPTDNATYDPGIPGGFLQGTDKAIFAEMGGHTLVYIKQGSSQFCYVGHRVNGSMGDGTTTDATETTFNCSGTPSLAVCGSVPITASTITSTISANPTSIAANGTSTSIITVQLKQSNGTNLTTTGGTVVITTNKGTISSVTDNNDGTYTAILTSSTFIETATLNYTLNGSSGTNSATVNFTNAANPTITITGNLKTFATCSGCSITPQSFVVSGTDLSTNNLVVTAPTGVQVSTYSNTSYSSAVTLTPSSGTVTNTTIYVKLTNNSTTASSGIISVTSTGASTKTVTVTTNTDNALNLDGTNDIVTIADNNALDLTTNYTIEAWIKPTAFSWLGGIVSKYHTNSSNGYILRLNGSGDYSGVTFDEMSTSNGVLSLNKWQHIAAVNNNGTRKIYINGVEQSITGTPLTAAANSDPVIIGQDFSASGSRFFNGSIDEVRIWNTARSTSEITSNMNSTLSGTETGLVAYYNFNQGTANGTNTSVTSLIDYTSNALSGTISGVALSGTSSNFVDGFVSPIQTYPNAAGNNNAISFDGSNDYIESNVNGTNVSQFTIEAFINPSNTTQNTKGILSWADQTSSGGPMVLMQQNQSQLSVYVNAGYNMTTTLSANTWSHIALTYANSLYTLYVNGVSVATYSGGLAMQSTASKLFLGNGYNGYWNGLMDEVRVWNVARSGSQIQKNMFNDLTGTESGLIAYYPFNQGIPYGSNTNTLLDKTANAYNGTLINMALIGTNSNFVGGNLQIGASATIAAGGTYQLANALTGGTWSSSNTSVATVNSATGVVTGVIAGTASITYTICGKSTSYLLTVYTPTVTVTSAFKTFTMCSGCAIPPQSFTVQGSDLAANVTITAPTGFEVSDAISGTYSSTLNLVHIGGALNTTPVYVRLINTGASATSGILTVVSAGAVSSTITLNVNTDNALNFDGTDAINIGQPITTGNSYTMEAWIKYQPPIGNNTASNVISTYRNPFFISTDNKLYAGVNSAFTVVVSPSEIPQNVWTHVAVSFDNATKSMLLYINGNQVASGTAASGFTLVGLEPLFIGAHSNSSFTPTSYFKGNIDEVRIWNRVRSSSEIANNMFTELSGVGEPNLKAYYNFNQGIINGINTGITYATDASTSAYSTASITSFTRTGNTSNFVAGFIPSISGTTTTNVGASSTLTNSLTGGTWSSSNTSIATVNSSTGAVTGVAAGATSITYTICEKSVTTSFVVTVPTITTTGTLTAFSSCTGTASASQSFSVSAQYLTSNLVLTAPTGYELSLSSSGTYSTTVSIVPTSGTVSSTPIYVRLKSNAFNGASGNISATSSSATTQYIATGTATVSTNVTASVSISSNANSNTTCAGTSVVFTATPTNGGNTPTYQWKVNGSNVGTNSATYSTSSLSNNDVVTVVMTSSISSCVTGSPATSNALTMTVNTVPVTPGSIVGNTSICLTSNQVYNISAVAGATSYEWVTTGNITATPSTTNAINITAANTAGAATIKVRALNACGYSAYSATLSITVSNTPAPTANFTLSANNVCLGTPTVNFTNTSSVNSSTLSPITAYSWDFGDGSPTVTTQDASRNYTAAGTYNVIMSVTSLDNCNSSITKSVIVDPLSVAGTAVANSAAICSGSSTTVSLSGNTGTIQWMSSPAGANTWTNVLNGNTSTINTGNLTSSTDFKAVVTSGLCSSATTNIVTITVNPLPVLTVSTANIISNTATSFDLNYTITAGSPDSYSINTISPNSMPGFVALNNFGLVTSPISVAIPASSDGNYTFEILGINSTTGCVSNSIPFNINVGVLPPAGLLYNTPNVYTVGTTITSLNPTSTGGPITSYTIAPSLPGGLTINPTTGVISGTPSVSSGQTTYVVTGTNTSGTVTATVVITVNIAAPAGLSYNTPNVYPVGTNIIALNPTSTGGAISSYSISPTLPNGLSFNTTTGVISGLPTLATILTTYTVTGINASGSITATLDITVVDNTQPPLPPTVLSKKYLFNSGNLPNSLNLLVSTVPPGCIPVWCDAQAANCVTTPPVMPTEIGKYIYQLRSYDTTAMVYSTDFVNDTIIITPPPPVVFDSTYVLGVVSNPTNVSIQVTGLTGATFNYFVQNVKVSGAPNLGSTIGLKRYTVSQTVNGLESDTVGFNVTLLDPNTIIHLQKLVDPAILQPNSTYNYTFRFIVTNLTKYPFSNVVITDNLQNSVPISSDYNIVNNQSSGGLVANNAFNGNSDINVTNTSSVLTAQGKDSAKFVMNLNPKGFSGVLSNIAYVKATTKWGVINMQSTSETAANATAAKKATRYDVNDLQISIPEGFSPNFDGINDKLIIIKPYNVTIEIEIFNRWGNVVYSNKNYQNDWNGKGTGNFAGKDLVDGGYYYSIRAIEGNGKGQLLKGSIIIQR